MVTRNLACGMSVVVNELLSEPFAGLTFLVLRRAYGKTGRARDHGYARIPHTLSDVEKCYHEVRPYPVGPRSRECEWMWNHLDARARRHIIYQQCPL